MKGNYENKWLEIKVATGKPYSVFIGKNIIKQLGGVLHSYSGRKIAIITDPKVYRIYGSQIINTMTQGGFMVEIFIAPEGESAKTISTFEEALEFLAENHICKSDLILAFGGGVVGDLTGFVAAVYQRGVDFIQIPTTFLAAIDASVGGKTAINLSAGKNQVGVFHQPSAVFCDYSSLSTMDDVSFKDGIAECVKYGILGNQLLFESLRAPINKNDPRLGGVIGDCIAYKAKIVAEDEYDGSTRQFLNLGHTIGHAVEAASGFKTSHGYAVGIGLAFIARISHALGYLAEKDKDAIIETLKINELPVTTDYSPELLLSYCSADKKIRGDKITLVLIEGIGRCFLKTVALGTLQEYIELGKS